MNKLRRKNNLILLLDAGKVLEKIQHQFLIKTHRELASEGDLLSLMKNSCKKLSLTSYLVARDGMNGCFPSEIRNKVGMFQVHPTLYWRF